MRGSGNGEAISDTGRLVPVGDVMDDGAAGVVLVVVVVAATSILTGAFNRMLLRIASFRSNSFEALMVSGTLPSIPTTQIHTETNVF